MPRLHPYSPIDRQSTPEQEALAIVETRKCVIVVRDLMRELDIPSDQFSTVYAIFQGNLNAIGNEASSKLSAERHRKMSVVRAKRLEAIPPHMRHLGDHGLYQTAFDPLDDATDEEVEAAYQAAIKKS